MITPLMQQVLIVVHKVDGSQEFVMYETDERTAMAHDSEAGILGLADSCAQNMIEEDDDVAYAYAVEFHNIIGL